MKKIFCMQVSNKRHAPAMQLVPSQLRLKSINNYRTNLGFSSSTKCLPCPTSRKDLISCNRSPLRLLVSISSLPPGFTESLLFTEPRTCRGYKLSASTPGSYVCRYSRNARLRRSWLPLVALSIHGPYSMSSSYSRFCSRKRRNLYLISASSTISEKRSDSSGLEA